MGTGVCPCDQISVELQTTLLSGTLVWFQMPKSLLCPKVIIFPLWKDYTDSMIFREIKYPCYGPTPFRPHNVAEDLTAVCLGWLCVARSHKGALSSSNKQECWVTSSDMLPSVIHSGSKKHKNNAQGAAWCMSQAFQRSRFPPELPYLLQGSWEVPGIHRPENIVCKCLIRTLMLHEGWCLASAMYVTRTLQCLSCGKWEIICKGNLNVHPAVTIDDAVQHAPRDAVSFCTHPDKTACRGSRGLMQLKTQVQTRGNAQTAPPLNCHFIHKECIQATN